MKEELKNVYDHIDKNFETYIEKIRNYLKIPSISITGEGIEKGAEATAELIKGIGGDAKLVPLIGYPGHPVVYGKIKSKNTKAKTLLFYSHYDDVDVTPEDWTVPPYDAEIVDAKKIDLPVKMGKVIVARSATDKKGVLCAFILTLGAIKEVLGEIPVNVIFTIEGEEEMASPNFKQFVDKYRDELNDADACYASGSYRQLRSGLLIIHPGYNGGMEIDLEIKGGRWGGTIDGKPVWAAYADFVDQPLLRLVHAISTMLSLDGKVLVEGFYDNWVPPTSEEIREIEKTMDRIEETGITQGLNSVKRFRGGRSPEEFFKDFLTTPHLVPLGISSGYKELIPMTAKARFHARFGPNLSSEEILQKIRRHLYKCGFPEIEVSCTNRVEWARSSTSEDVVQALIRMAEIHGVEYVVWPSSPAFCPVYLFNRPPFSKPVVFGALGHGNRFHQHDEYITVEGVRDQMKGVVTFLHEYASG